MMDIKRSFFQIVDVQIQALGSTVTDEGQGLVAVVEDGIEKVKPSAGGAGEAFVGFATFRQRDVTTKASVEELSVPSAAPYDVELAASALISGQVRVHDVLANSDLVVVLVAPAPGQVQVNLTTGMLTFNAAEAGRAMKSYYRFNLTLAQSRALYYDLPTNYPDANLFGTVGVGKGKGRIFVGMYDQSIDWSAVAAGTITLMAGGMLTVGGAGPLVPGARVVKVPTAGIGQAYLGVEFNA